MNEKPAIVIPLDGSPTAVAALGAAQAMTNMMKAVLHIVHVAEGRLPEDRLLENLKVGPLEVEACLLDQISGDPVDAILDFASSLNVKMIVMSSHGWTYDRQYLVGSTAMGILLGATTPVLVIRPGMTQLPDPSWKPVRMLSPLDGSPLAASQMRRIFELAKLMGVDIDVLNVAVSGAERPAEVGTMTAQRYQDYPQYDLPAWADEFVRRFCVYQPPEVELRLFQLAGDPVDVIVNFASQKKEDLIVLTWRGRLEAQRAQTIKGLLRKAEVPVLLIKTR